MTICTTIGIVSTKGGVGKTSTSAALAAILADMGQRVLMIDGVFQQSLSDYYRLSTIAEDGLMDKETIESTNTSDPISKTKLKVSIDQLQPYELNPRRQKNVKYDGLLASIEAVGLDHPPRITRRKPDDDKYSILKGGNTRLAILKELYEKYSILAKAEQDAAAKQSLLEKALSFYEINCWLLPATVALGNTKPPSINGVLENISGFKQ